MNGPCPYSCTNKTKFGYCKTTACLYAPTVTIRVGSNPKTRADQIRAMSDEELAKWINHHPICPYDREDLDDHVCKLNCKQCWLDWLRQEVIS